MNNRFNINEEEKNRIKGLHSIGVIEEQWKTIELGEEEEWERGKKKRGKSGPGTYGNDDVFPGPEESAISRFLKSKEAGMDTPGGNPEYFYGDGSLDKLRNMNQDEVNELSTEEIIKILKQIKELQEDDAPAIAQRRLEELFEKVGLTYTTIEDN